MNPNENRKYQSSSLQQEVNFWHLLNYIYTYRLFIFVITIGFPAIVSFFFVMARPTFRTTVFVNIDMSHSEKDFKSHSLSSINEDQQTANKINFVEQYFESPALRNLAFGIVNNPADEILDRVQRSSIRHALDTHETMTKEEQADWLFSQLNIKPTGDKNRLEISSAASDPILAAALADLGSKSLLRLNHYVLIREIVTLKKFLQTQTESTKNELMALEGQLANLQKQAKVISIEEMRAKTNTLQLDEKTKYAELSRQYDATSIVMNETEADLKNLKKIISEDSSVSQLYIDQVQRRLEVLRFERAQSAPSRGIASTKESTSLDQDIAKVQGDLDRQLNSGKSLTTSPWEYIKKLEANLFELKQKRNALKGELLAHENALHHEDKKFSELPQQLRDLTEIKRNIELTTNLYTALKTREQDTNIREAASANDLVIIAPAQIPKKHSGMGVLQATLISTSCGFLFALLILFIRYVTLQLIRDETELRNLGFQHLGSLPFVRRPHDKFSLNPQGIKLLRKENADARFKYAMELIRLRLQRTLQEMPLCPLGAGRVVTLSSTSVGEGRTFFAVNLADSWASKNKKVCLLDLNFDNLRARRYFAMPSDEVSQVHEFEDFVIRSTPLNLNFDLFEGFSKKPNRNPDSFESDDFYEFIADLRNEYNLVLIDAPEVQLHAETVHLIQKSDAVITIINQRTTLVSDLQAGVNFLQSMSETPNFSILNFAFDDFRELSRKSS